MRAGCADRISFGSAVALGLAVSTGYPAGLVAAIAMPAACLTPRTRKAVFRNAVGYYSAGLWPMIPGALRYLDRSSSASATILMWLCCSMLLALPWTLVWTPRSRLSYMWRVPLATLAFIVTPLALIGFITPVTGAGYLFPGSGWLGLAAATLLPAALMSLWRCTLGAARTSASLLLAAIITLGIATNVCEPSYVPAPAGWVAVDTSFGDLSQSYQEFRAMQDIQRRVTTASARVMIFPESVVPRWSEATAEFWRQTLVGCRSRGQVIAMGVGLPRSALGFADVGADAEFLKQYNFAAAIEALRVGAQGNPVPANEPSWPDDPQTDSYENILLFLGGQSSAFLQRVPIPVGMWRPLTGRGVPLHLNSPGVIELDRQRVAVLICYEQILVYPVLASMLRRPTVIVGISNMYWFSGTTIPHYQESAVRAWAKLFGVSYLTATNH